LNDPEEEEEEYKDGYYPYDQWDWTDW